MMFRQPRNLVHTISRIQAEVFTVGSRVDGQEIEFEIQVPGEPVKRKARAPIDKAIDTHLKFQNRF